MEQRFSRAWFRHGFARKSFRYTPGVLRRLLPRSLWFRAVSHFSMVQQRLLSTLCGRDWNIEELLYRDLMLSDLTVHGGAFPVRVTRTGVEHLSDAYSLGKGVLVAGVHLPGHIFLASRESHLGIEPVLVVSHPTSHINGGSYIVVGTGESVAAVCPGTQALLRARSILRGGGCVITMLEYSVGECMESAMVTLAGKLGSPVVFCWTEWPAGGDVVMHFMPTPDPVCDTPEKVDAAIAMIAKPYYAAVRELYPGAIRGAPAGERLRQEIPVPRGGWRRASLQRRLASVATRRGRRS